MIWKNVFCLKSYLFQRIIKWDILFFIMKLKQYKKWRRKDIAALFLIIVFIFIITWFIKSYFSHGFVYSLFQNDTSAITDSIGKFGTFAYIIFVLLIFMECVFAPFPPLILYIAGGTLFGGFIAGILATIGNFLGAAAAFQISNHYGKEKVLPKIPMKLRNKFDKYSEKYGPLSIFILRVNPITTSDLFSYLAGLTKMKFSKFLFATTFGLIPTIFIQTYLGERIQGHPLLTKISLIAGVIYLGFFILGYIWAKKRIKKIN